MTSGAHPFEYRLEGTAVAAEWFYQATGKTMGPIPQRRDLPGPMTTSTSSSTRTHKRRFQFSLRTLLLLTAAVAVGAGLFKRQSDGARAQRAAAERIRQLRGYAYYDYQVDTSGSHYKVIPNATPPGPKWLHDLLGVDFFCKVKVVDFFECGANPKHTVEDYAAFESLKGLEMIVNFDSDLCLEGVRHWRRLPKLRSLTIEQTGLSDSQLEPLCQLTQLDELRLTFNEISDSGAMKLRSMTALKHLDLRGNRISEEAAAELRKALPNCEIENWRRR